MNRFVPDGGVANFCCNVSATLANKTHECSELKREVAELRLENATLKREMARLENAIDLVPNPGVTPGQPRPHHRCTCGGHGHE